MVVRIMFFAHATIKLQMLNKHGLKLEGKILLT
jgi:hypothetical protein